MPEATYCAGELGGEHSEVRDDATTSKEEAIHNIHIPQLIA
jgi:hypothetical protein